MRGNLTISLFNPTNLSKQAISYILKLTETSSLLFLTEAWLLSPNKYLITWRQFHTYGVPVNSYNAHRG